MRKRKRPTKFSDDLARPVVQHGSSPEDEFRACCEVLRRFELVAQHYGAVTDGKIDLATLAWRMAFDVVPGLQIKVKQKMGRAPQSQINFGLLLALVLQARRDGKPKPNAAKLARELATFEETAVDERNIKAGKHKRGRTAFDTAVKKKARTIQNQLSKLNKPLLFSYANEIVALLYEGKTAEEIEQIVESQSIILK